MVALYLYANAALYALFAAWCSLRLDSTSRSLGYLELANGGRSEYATVYGGLQWGLALVFLYLALKPELHRVGLLAALALYAPIVLHRLVTLVKYAPVGKLTTMVAALEVIMLVLAVALWFATPARAQS